MEIKEKDLMVGDFIVVDVDDVIRVDGVLIRAMQLSINEGRTVLRRDAKNKHSFFNLKTYGQTQQQFDPFVFAGSSVIYGKG